MVGLVFVSYYKKTLLRAEFGEKAVPLPGVKI